MCWFVQSQWYSSRILNNFSSVSDESRNWSVGKVGDVTPIIPVAAQLKARSETELFRKAHT